MYTLSNTFLSVSFSALGAELQSVKNAQGIEYMWQADKAVWPRHAPVLFPIVGKLKNNTYRYNNKYYSLSQHGFARDLVFTVVKHSATELVFELKSNEKTLENYPFVFSLQIAYSLIDNKLSVNYSVSNTSTEALYYSIGAHPGFRCPILPSDNFSDYYLQFERGDLQITLLNDGLLSSAKQALTLSNKNQLALTHALFDSDALVFESAQINSVELCSTKHPHKVRLECPNWPYFGIWSKKGESPFVCLEPWYGIADTVDAPGELPLKKGILSLAPGKHAEHRHAVLFF